MNQVDNHYTALILIGTVAMFILVTSFLLALIYSQRRRNKHQKDMQQLKETQQNQLIETAIRSEEIERHRIAEQLHDEVGAILSATKLHFLGIKPEHLNETDLRLYLKSKDLMDDAIQKIRAIAHDLHSNILKEFGLNEAIRHFLNKTTHPDLVNIHLSLDENYNAKGIEDDISIYRIFQELFNNIIKYAHAREISVETTFNQNILSVNVSHNGKGLTQDDFEQLRYKTDGLGLRNIQNRIILLRGAIAFFNKNDKYFIYLSIPKNRMHEKDQNRYS